MGWFLDASFDGLAGSEVSTSTNWNKHPSSTGDTNILDSFGKKWTQADTGINSYYFDDIALSDNVKYRAGVWVGNVTGRAGWIFQASPTLETWYLIEFNVGPFTIYRYDNGTPTTLTTTGSLTSWSWSGSGGDEFEIEFEVNEGVINVELFKASVSQGTCTATDGGAPLAAGYTGIRHANTQINTHLNLISAQPFNIGPEITGPDTTTEGSATVATGTLLDTVTTFSLISGSYSIAQTIDSQTATTLDYVAESGVNLCSPGNPVSGVPLEPTVTAADITPYIVQQKADDGVNPPATRNITLNGEATNEVIQAMIATSNVTEGESIFAPSIIDVENDMQVYVPKVVNGVTITYASDGTFTVDQDKSISVPVVYWSAATGEWSCISLQILATGGAVLTPFDTASYALRSYIRKVVFHSKLIITTRGRAEEYILHDAMTVLGGASMSPPADGVTPEVGWLGTQTVTEFNKRIAKLPSEQTAEVISNITTHLTMLGWA